MPDNGLLLHGEAAHYHRRYVVLLLSQGWTLGDAAVDRVPLVTGLKTSHQKNGPDQ